MKISNILAQVLLSAGLLGKVAGQDSPIRVDVRLVELTASVLDRHGHYVDNLPAERFEIFDEGLPQKLGHFEADSSELSCALLIDTTGSMKPTLSIVKNAAVKLIDQLGPNDVIAVYRFNDRLTTLQEFTRDKAAAK